MDWIILTSLLALHLLGMVLALVCYSWAQSKCRKLKKELREIQQILDYRYKPVQDETHGITLPASEGD